MLYKTKQTESPISDNLKRIVIVGSSGSGKTTLAQGISKAIGNCHIELDALRHGPNWAETPDDIFCQKIAEATRMGNWVVDGNYSVARDVLWPNATTLIYLDYSIGVVMRRLITRTLRRSIMGEELWNGNRENILDNLKIFSDDSVIAYSLKNHWKRRKKYIELFQHPDYTHIQKLRFYTPKDTEVWLAAQ